MASDRLRAGAPRLRLMAGALVLAALIWLLIELLTRTHLYATAGIVALAAALAMADLFRALGRADVALSQILERLTSGVADRPSGATAFPALALAADQAAERLRQGRELRQREVEYLKSLLDTVPAALLVLRDDGSLALANRAAFALAGREVERLSDMAVLGEAAEAIAALPAGARAVVPMADDRKMFVSVSQLTHPGGRVWRLAALQSVSGDLDVVEQTAWRDLIRVLAHEMMNSLTPIASLSESLGRKAQADPEMAEALGVIARRSANLMDFVDRYRAVAELPQPVPRPVSLLQLSRDVERLARSAAPGRDIDFRVEVTPSDLEVTADPQLLEQALINLIKNAIEATAQTPAAVVVLSCLVGAGQVRIAVADNGEGIEPDKAEAIFVPFFSSRHGGSGIGLSLARQIVLAHGGQLTVRPNPPRGAVFEITLPA